MTATPVVLSKQYIEQREEGYWIIGSRVSLDSIVYAFLRGTSPESILHSFPTLTLEQVYGAIAFYLANQAAIDAYLREGETRYAELRQVARQQNLSLYEKLNAAKAEQQ
jgi:uncharacterized protein (DUF433 family)